MLMPLDILYQTTYTPREHRGIIRMDMQERVFLRGKLDRALWKYVLLIIAINLQPTCMKTKILLSVSTYSK